MILPILCYIAEMWGYERTECIEHIQLKVLKRVLGVNNTTSNLALLAKRGRYPLYVNYLMYHILAENNQYE